MPGDLIHHSLWSWADAEDGGTAGGDLGPARVAHDLGTEAEADGAGLQHEQLVLSSDLQRNLALAGTFPTTEDRFCR